ncbi:MAG: hypothetical protein IT438_11510 [Phycisphaerales bacterium]|nr:hypothetical protein [Phycisphaerales bacterium]
MKLATNSTPETAPRAIETPHAPAPTKSEAEQFGPPKPPDAQLSRAVDQALNDALGIKDPVADHTEADPGAGEKPATHAETSAAPSKGDAKPPADAKAKLMERPDGTVLVDDKYVIKGKGTESDPFIVSWEMLVSAKDTYQPRLGRKVIPDRLKMIDGKWVKIAGFIAFPLAATSQDEMLMMLNQWDGCCIGIPPEPYDAIEVKLKVPVVGDDRMRVSGSIKGIIRVDPYLIKDWLVSLYLMDDAELFKDEKAAVRSPGVHQGGRGSSQPDDEPR